MSTKSQQVAQLLLRPEGCSYSDAIAVTGWSSISIQWHAKNNGLRLRVERTKGQPQRYFGERRKIEVRKIIKAPPAPDPLTAFCAAHHFDVTLKGSERTLRCQRCYLGFRIFQKDNSVNSYLSKHIRQHAETHRRKEISREQCDFFAQ
jgi:hypothetical protein